MILDLLHWLITAGLLVAVFALARESRLLARRRREHARRIEMLERGLLEVHRQRTVADVRRRLGEAGRLGQLEVVCRAQGVEDCYLWELLAPSAGLAGRFIEAGAADGVRNSVTWLLEAAGWTGVLVEADPRTAAQCARSRPHSHVVQAALGAPGSGPEGGAAGARTVTFTRVLGEADADHLSHVPELARVRSVYAQKAKRSEQIEVPLRTITDVLAEAPGPSRYDVAVIDVEGAELALLRGFDLARFPAAVLMVEDLTGGADAEVEQLVAAAGYVRAGRVERNTVYIRREREDLLQRAAEMGWWPAEDRVGR